MTKQCDHLRRLTPTPLLTDVKVMGRMMRLETNSTTVFDCVVRLFGRYEGPGPAQSGFRWRIVSERQTGLKPPWPEMAAFSGDALRYVNLGQRSFLAVDLESREAVAFLSEELAGDTLGLSSVFLATLFDLSAVALGLIQISAACVALEGRALLIFGPPRSGKTTSTYLAGKAGLEFHADQATYLEFEDGSIRAWGQFWPAAFRTETSAFLPELTVSARPFAYGDLNFLCFDQHPFETSHTRSVLPVICAFLERNALQQPRLIRMPSLELGERLQQSLPFRDDERFESERNSVLCALGELPAYRLQYGKDPADAAGLFRGLLEGHDPMEERS